MALFVVAHGAWSAGWAWKKMHPLLSARGHRLITPTYTGLGERAHLARPDIDLDTHIADIVNVLEFEDLGGVNLIGHSYGGMVATGVADRARVRVAQLIYLDAFAPNDGDSVLDLLPPAARAQRQAGEDGFHSGGADAGRYVAGRRRLVQAATPAAASKDVRAEAALAQLPADIAAPLHLLRAPHARRPLPPISRACQARRLGRVRNRFQPQSAHHLSAGAGGLAYAHRGLDALALSNRDRRAARVSRAATA